MVTQEQLAELDDAIARGLLEVRDGTSVVRYQTTEDMLKARKAIADILATQVNGARSTPRYQLADFRDDA